MSQKQFREWRVFADLEPFDETRQDIRIAHIVVTLLNLWRGKGKPAIGIEDVLLPFGDKPPKGKKKQTWQEQKRIGFMLASMFNRQHDMQERRRKRRENVKGRGMTPMEKHKARKRPTFPGMEKG